MSDLPAPLTPPECDLRGMPYMPLELMRLFDSDLYMLSSGDEFKAALSLWGKSFYQIPAGSLPSDERLLAHLSGAKNWQDVEKMAMRGWIKCDDGRLYHPTVAEKVAEAWQARLARRARTYAARTARHKAPDKDVTDHVTDSKGTEQNRIKVKMKEDEESDDGFEVFWRAYPRKVGKGQARRAWSAALKKTDSTHIIAALNDQTFDHREQFQPHPATWLNGERWLDENPAGDPVLRAAGVAPDAGNMEDEGWSLLQ